MTAWTTADIPHQGGRIAVVTGANTGLGLETARELARAGATVVLAVRNLDKGKAAVDNITATVPDAAAHLQQLDLSSLANVREAATQLRDRWEHIDLLINNAGVMYTPFTLTTDGFELQFATNHLGHFALTGLLLDRLTGVEGSRIVTVSSNGHKLLGMPFDRPTIESEEGHNRYRAYHRSKLANLLFTYALDRRLRAARVPTMALAAHPGGSATELDRHLPAFLQPALNLMMPVLAQSAAQGAHPQLRAATDPMATGSEYFGPDGIGELRGAAVRVQSNAKSHDTDLQEHLWSLSENLTGVTYDL